jgi:hypothetical protein
MCEMRDLGFESHIGVLKSEIFFLVLSQLVDMFYKCF